MDCVCGIFSECNQIILGEVHVTADKSLKNRIEIVISLFAGWF